MKERIETIIDRLWEYVHLNGKTSSGQAAAALGLTAEQVEKLALLLEEHGLIEVRYGLLGVTLFDLSLLAPSVQKKEKTQSDEKTQAQQLESEVLKAENLMVFFEKDLRRRIEKAESLLSELEKKEQFSRKELNDLAGEVDMALGQLAAFSDEIRLLSEKEEEFLKKLNLFRQKINRLASRHETQESTSIFYKIRKFWEKLWTPPLGKPAKSKPARLSSPVVTFIGVKKTRVLQERKDKIREHYWVTRKRRSE